MGASAFLCVTHVCTVGCFNIRYYYIHYMYSRYHDILLYSTLNFYSTYRWQRLSVWFGLYRGAVDFVSMDIRPAHLLSGEVEVHRRRACVSNVLEIDKLNEGCYAK